jgi:hypothetical protein
MNKSNKIANEDFELFTAVSGSTTTDEIMEREENHKVLKNNYILTKRLSRLENRQRKSESTTTDWIIDIESRITNLEGRNEEVNNEKKQLRINVDILSEIGQLQNNWNQYGADKFKQELIFKCLKIINHTDLQFQPEIFPTAQHSIQFEYEPDDNHYLELEIFEERIKLYLRVNSEIRKMSNLTTDETIKEINEFQSRFA